MIVSGLIIGAVLVLVGVLCYKFPNLINPYGGMSPERKALVDIDGLKRGMLWVSVAVGVAFMLTAVFSKFLVPRPQLLVVIDTVLPILFVVAALVVMIRHNGFAKDSNGTCYWHDRKRTVVTVVAMGIALATIGLTVWVLVMANKAATIEVTREGVHISGEYGRDIPAGDIVTMEVLDKMPAMARRTNGSSFKNKHKGHFLSVDNEKCLLFVTYNGGPYVKLRTGDDLIYMNRETPEATEALVEELKGIVK